MKHLAYEGSTQAFPINGIVVVGVCASGKTTLTQELRPLGIPVRAVAQEHSLVPRLFRRSGMRPLVLLTANWETVHRRRRLDWDPGFFLTEWKRLEEARQQADLIVQTDWLSPHQVAVVVTRWWDGRMQIDHVRYADRLPELRRHCSLGMDLNRFL